MRNNQGLWKCQLLVLVDTTHSEKQIKGRAKRPQPSSLAERDAPTCHPTAGLHRERERERKMSLLHLYYGYKHISWDRVLCLISRWAHPSADRLFLWKQAHYLCTNNSSTNSIYQNTAVWPENVSTVAAATRWIPSEPQSRGGSYKCFFTGTFYCFIPESCNHNHTVESLESYEKTPVATDSISSAFELICF